MGQRHSLTYVFVGIVAFQGAGEVVTINYYYITTEPHEIAFFCS